MPLRREAMQFCIPSSIGILPHALALLLEAASDMHSDEREAKMRMPRAVEVSK